MVTARSPCIPLFLQQCSKIIADFRQSKSKQKKEEYMKRRLNVFIRIFHILPLALLLFGCATPMQMPVQDLSQIEHKEGIVVGSVVIKGGKDILGRKGFELQVEGIDPHLKNFSIDVEREGEETVFVTKMLGGNYHFTRLVQTGFSNLYANIDVPFSVHPGKPVYIGRLLIEFPEGKITIFTELAINVEDAKDQTLAAAEKTHGDLVRNAVTDLMGKDRFQAIKLPETFEEVWYRPGKKGFSLKAYSHSGTLTIGRDALEFSCKEKQLTVPYSSILEVRWGKVGMDWVNSWSVVRLGVEGSEGIAAFKDGKALGWGSENDDIYRTLKKAFADYTASEAR